MDAPSVKEAEMLRTQMEFPFTGIFRIFPDKLSRIHPNIMVFSFSLP